MLVTLPELGWIRGKREGKRWKAKLHWRSLFRTSNRQCFSQQSAGLQGDGVVISWQRGAGHVGTTQADIKDTRPWEYWLYTHSFSLCLWHLFLLICLSLSTHFSHLSAPLRSLAHTHSQMKGFGTCCRESAVTVWKKRFESEKDWKWVLKLKGTLDIYFKKNHVF